MSSSLIDLFTMLAELTFIPLGKTPVANFANGIAALGLMSSPTIVPSKILLDTTAPSLIWWVTTSFLLS